MMKRHIFIVVAFCFAIFIDANNPYYYSNSKKISLTENPSNAIVIYSRESDSNNANIGSFKVLMNFKDDAYKIALIQKNESTSYSSLKSQAANANSIIAVYPTYYNEDGQEIIPTGYIYVELKDSSDYNKLKYWAEEYDCEIMHKNKFMPLWYTLQITGNSIKNPIDISTDLTECGDFKTACPSLSIDLSISYDPYVNKQWGLYNLSYENIDISISDAWNFATGRNVNVAVIDQGIELTHKDLVSNIHPKSYDAATCSSPSGIYNEIGDEDGESIIGHGTHCAGIIGAVRNNNIHIAGVAPDSKLMSISVDFTRSDISEQLANAVNWAWQNGADILSCSWAGPECSIIGQALDNAISDGRNKKGSIIVCAAGNGFGNVKFPANYREEIIAVGNIDKTGTINFWSCFGEELLVCAPGTDILSTMINNTTAYMSGTSMACPHVSGVVALMLEINPKITSSKVREIIAKNAQKIGHMEYSTNKKYGTWNEGYGYGLIDAYNTIINTPRR